MQAKFLSSIVVLFFLIQSSPAAEIDSVTPRKIDLENSRDQINRIFNERIKVGIENANHGRNSSCDEAELYEELRKAIFQSFTASWGLKGYGLDKQLREILAEKSYSLSLNDSIYRDINYLEGFSLNLKELSDVVNINGHLIGLDKLGHFFAEGWSYFNLTQNDDQNLHEALEWGRQQETGKFGYLTTGIFSFSDLSANFNGWRFWNKVLLRDNDPLKGFVGNLLNRPYAKCKIQIIDSFKHKEIIREWEHTSSFQVSDYLDGSWDEGNNCNSFEDPVIEEKVNNRIQQIYPDFNCPVKGEQCLQSKEKYGYYAKYILHPQCLVVQ